MTERENIIEAINSVQAYGIMSNAFGGDLLVINEILADKLIEAGFGYIKDLKTELRSKVDYIHEQDDVIKDYKHRAEVAELALKKACRGITRSLTWEKCNDIDLLAAEILQRFYLNNAEWHLREEAKNE